MTPELLSDIALVPALRMLPPQMDSRAARAMLVAIALQESDSLQHRRQMAGGPARGFWQFERGGGVKGVLTHATTKPLIVPICRLLCYQPTAAVCHTAIEHNDILAAVFARLLLWTLPHELPRADDPVEGWSQYLAAWRPGKPHRHTWDAHYAEAWRIVKGEA